ncbi:TPA: O-antigen ligase family protein, partial [Vibrio cholerae]
GFMFSMNHDYLFLEPLRGFIRFLTIWTLFFIPYAINIDTETFEENLYSFLVIPGTILVIVALITGGYNEYQGQMRLSFPFSNPNSLALFSFLMIFISVLRLYTKKKAIFLVIILFYFYALIKSGGITSTLSALLFISLSAFMYFSGLKKIIILLVVFTVISLFIYLTQEFILARLDGVVFEDINTLTFSEGSSFFWRIRAWEVYLSTMEQWDFIIGHGIGVSRFILEPSSYISRYNAFSAPGTHNDYVQVLVDFGFVGLFILFFLCVNLFRKLYARTEESPKSNIILAFCISLLIYMTMDNVLDSRFFFVIILLLSVYCKKNIGVQ